MIVFWMLMCCYFRSVVSVMTRGKQLTLLVIIRYHFSFFHFFFFNSISVLANLPKLMGLPQRRDQIKSRRASNHFLNIKARFITGFEKIIPHLLLDSFSSSAFCGGGRGCTCAAVSSAPPLLNPSHLTLTCPLGSG